MPMPAGTVPTRTDDSGSVTFKDLRGSTRSMLVPNPGGGDLASFETVITEAAQMSNATPIRYNLTSGVEYDDSDAGWVVYDDAFSSVNTVAVFVFEDFVTSDIIRIEVPAVDAQFLAPGSDTIIDLGATPVGAFTAAALTHLNQGGASYDVKRGFLSERSKRSRGTVNKPIPAQILEPNETTSEPGDAPGTTEESGV